jgi:asparagine synthase (glutamine-hydrolysing)
VTEPYRRCSSKSPVQRAQYADVQIYLANDVLVKVDRMTMQHSVEVRAPLLDRRVIELAFRIPTHKKMPGLRSKYLLRQLARKRLPPEIATLPKHGFSAPMSEWLAGPCASRFREDVFSSTAPIRDLVDTTFVRRLFKEHRRRRADHGQVLWSIWMLAKWSAMTAGRRSTIGRRDPVESAHGSRLMAHAGSRAQVISPEPA